jgi:hypothetical protein
VHYLFYLEIAVKNFLKFFLFVVVQSPDFALFSQIPNPQPQKIPLISETCAQGIGYENQPNAQGSADKNPKIQNFFNCLYCNNLIPPILSKTPQISHQMRNPL